MVVHNPFVAAHGTKAGTWEKIVENLTLYDIDGAERGEPPMFEGVTSKTCKLRWEAQFLKYKDRVNKILNSTGVVVNETEHDRLLEQLYTNQVDAQTNKAATKAANDKKHQKQDENKAMGEELRAASIDKACYSSRDSDAGEESSSTSNSIQPSMPYYESKAELAQVRKQILHRDEERHKELQENHKESREMNQEHHNELMQAMRNNNEAINNQTDAFNRFTSVLERLIAK
ncbi:hypothetical protein BGZ76_006464 [Entomortierella beljakovae]|nr:hypothetical protein BGZ76_006464 [Entomortierella beljakovae]